jgi:hypothetical protein
MYSKNHKNTPCSSEYGTIYPFGSTLSCDNEKEITFNEKLATILTMKKLKLC